MRNVTYLKNVYNVLYERSGIRIREVEYLISTG